MRVLLPLLLAPALLRAEPLADRVDPIVRPYVDGGPVHGLTVGVLEARGAAPLLRGYGAGAHGPDAVYEIGSVTKVFTGVLLATLVRDGTVRLDQPVAELVPAAPEGITLLHLATHTSGLPRMPDNFEPADPRNPYADYTPERLLAFLERVEPEHVPGERHAYSNLGAGLLGFALAREAGKGYEALLREKVLAPLGLESTAVTLGDELAARLAPGHDGAGRPAPGWDIATLTGAGGVRSSAADMMRLLRAHLAEDGPLAAALALAAKVHFAPDDGVRMGLGWHVSPKDVRWHNGQTGGYHSFAAVDLAHGRAVVVLADTATPAVDKLGAQLLQLLAGEEVEPLPVRTEVEVAPDVLRSYVGSYRLAPTFVLTVTLEGGRLMVQATGQDKFPVFAESETEFFYKVVDARLTFRRDGEGKVTGLVLHQNGRDLPAAKVE